MSRCHLGRAFTLIEILIVVVILGVLAAIVLPQFTDASGQAMDTNVRSQLQTIRAQIELHAIERPFAAYGPATPLPTFWNELVENDYLQQAPRNPYSPPAERTLVGAVPGAWGWVWDGMDVLATDGMGGMFVE
jgi:prepilin-type N-terminal cleavage/methylation domain-containing protein